MPTFELVQWLNERPQTGLSDTDEETPLELRMNKFPLTLARFGAEQAGYLSGDHTRSNWEISAVVKSVGVDYPYM